MSAVAAQRSSDGAVAIGVITELGTDGGAVPLTLCTARPSSQCRRKARRLEPGPPTTQDLGKSRKVTWKS